MTPRITPHVPVSLTHHSLNSVVGYNKGLWQTPSKWTSAHLSALGLHRRHHFHDYQPSTINRAAVNEEDEDSDTDDECNHEGERGDENSHVFIPDLPPAHLRQFLVCFSGGGRYETRACRLIRLLSRMPPPIAAMDKDENRYQKWCRDSLPEPRISFQWMTPQLVIGSRMYKLHFLFHLLPSNALALPYVDSSCVLRPRFLVRRRRDLTRPFEPFIAAVLIGLAQSSVSSGKTDAERGQSNTNVAVKRVPHDDNVESTPDSLITVRTAPPNPLAIGLTCEISGAGPFIPPVLSHLNCTPQPDC